jgi:alpha-tubulin suppressor-like RCC1 family protein
MHPFTHPFIHSSVCVCVRVCVLSTFSFTWGESREGQCGHGDAARNLNPRRLQSLEAHRIVQLACGGGHSAFVSDDGALFGTNL